jgi:ABC-type sulfate/molybdate transport systems ATPase subunit
MSHSTHSVVSSVGSDGGKGGGIALQDISCEIEAGNGINLLSVVQKARVALARAMYAKDTRLLLLDDPLSAVDSHVGEHLFSKAITGDVARGMTRILVTHHVHILARCDKVIVFDHGRIKHQGKYQDLIDSGVDFAGAVDVSKIQESEEPVAIEELNEETEEAESKAEAKEVKPVEDKAA